MTAYLNCGSIIMEGDSYCSHCGANMKWDNDDKFESGLNGGGMFEITYDSAALFLGYGEIPETFHDSDEATLEYVVEGVCETFPQKMQLKARLREYWLLRFSMDSTSERITTLMSATSTSFRKTSLSGQPM